MKPLHIGRPLTSFVAPVLQVDTVLCDKIWIALFPPLSPKYPGSPLDEKGIALATSYAIAHAAAKPELQ